jgi:hypothetical protein
MRVAVAVPCTDRKRGGDPAPGALLRSVPADLAPDGRAERWVAQLIGERNTEADHPLADLYVGPGWTASLQLIAEASEMFQSDVDGFVISAGLGLQSLGSREAGWPRYSATFNSGHPDSVVVDRRDYDESSREWWSALGRSAALGGTTFTELAGSHGAVLVVASAAYLRAVAEDLAEAARSGLRVVAFTASKQRLGDLDELTVRLDARARSAVPASDARASADFVAYALRELGDDLLDITSARSFVSRTLEGRTAPRRPRGATARPEEVRSFIEDALREEETVKKGPLLRRWRDSGRAFEQRRFGAIYDDVVSGVRGGSRGKREGRHGG